MKFKAKMKPISCKCGDNIGKDIDRSLQKGIVHRNFLCMKCGNIENFKTVKY